MIARNTAPRGQRLTVLGAVFAAHVLLLIFFLQQRLSVPPPVAPVVIGLIAIATPPAAAVASKPPPLSVPAKLAVAVDPVPISIAPDLVPKSAPGMAGACSTLGDISAALLADPVALEAIRLAPPETRSVADAVVVWSAGWAASTIDPAAPLAPVRALVESFLLASEDRCLDEALAGPRLMAIPDGERTMFLVFGSGVWTWRQLVTPDPLVSNAIAGSAVPIISPQ